MPETKEKKTSGTTINKSKFLNICPPRLNRYSKGQGIANHTDHISSLFENWQGIPVLSLVGLFNDDYKGGVPSNTLSTAWPMRIS